MSTTETYITQEGDSVDLIAYRRFGTHGMEASIWTANPGLAARGPILPAGLSITIPVPEVKDRTVNDRLWD